MGGGAFLGGMGSTFSWRRRLPRAEGGERHSRGKLEVEAAATHGTVDHGALEALQLGQVLVDEVGDLDEGRRAALACTCTRTRIRTCATRLCLTAH